MNDLGVLEDGGVAVHRGQASSTSGRRRARRGRYRAWRRIVCRGRTVLPGLVDAHTHPVFARMREDEFALRCRGATTRRSSRPAAASTPPPRAWRTRLSTSWPHGVRRRLDRMLLHGTTGVEAKSGYGLTTETEMQEPAGASAARRRGPSRRRVVPHVPRRARDPAGVPRATGARYVREVIERDDPARRRAASSPRSATCSWRRAPSRSTEGGAILEAGTARTACGPRCTPISSATAAARELAAEVGADQRRAPRRHGPGRASGPWPRAGVIPVLLPAACLFLGLERPDARGMIEAGCAVALATDFNPGSSPTENLHLVASLGCTRAGHDPGGGRSPPSPATPPRRAGLEATRGRIACGRPANLARARRPVVRLTCRTAWARTSRTRSSPGAVVVERGRRVGVRKARP